MVAYGWKSVALVWAGALAVMAILFFVFTKDDPDLAQRRASGAKPEPLSAMMEPLKNIQVWRFSLYYFFVFGAFVALALWLPRYLIGVYGLDIATAGMIGAMYSIPASVFRAYGGHLSDKYGARTIMYWTFLVSIVCTFILSYPPTSYVVDGIRGPVSFSTRMGLGGFIITAFVLGFFMSLGKAAVYKHIPVYYPGRVGAVGGVVGLVGGLGGFILPIAFGALNDLTGVWQSCFWLLFMIVTVATLWMHFAIRSMEKQAIGQELASCRNSPKCSRSTAPRRKAHWRPRGNPGLAPRGRAVLAGARADHRSPQPLDLRALPAALIRGLDGVVGRGREAAERGLCLHHGRALLARGLAGPVRRDAAHLLQLHARDVRRSPLDDARHMVAAHPGRGHGYGGAERCHALLGVPAARAALWTWRWQLRLLHGEYLLLLPKAEKGNALAINAGLGNLGVSVVQFVVPLAITAGVFGALGGNPQSATLNGVTTTLWLQNAGYVFVPFIVASAFAAWFGMNDIASMKASFADQAVIFRRTHNWVMCWLYTGTFGSFIGFSAAFPLLAKILFPDVNVLQYAFLGPLVGAVARALAGKPCDRIGGGRITFWVFVAMSLGVAGILYAIGMKGSASAFPVFFASFLFLFAATGVGNASTFQMIPAIMRQEVARLEPGLKGADLVKQSDKESAAIIGFTSAIAAYGAFFIPKSFGTSIAMTGSAAGALYAFLGFYLTCIAITWWFYTRRGGLLHDTERGLTGPAAMSLAKAA